MTDMINNHLSGSASVPKPSRSGGSAGEGAASGMVDTRGRGMPVERQENAAPVGTPSGSGQDASGSTGREGTAPVAAEDLEPVVESINAYLQNSQRSLEFSVDDSTGRTVITVMDADREEVIRQIPPEQMLALAEHFEDERDLGGTGFVDKA
ncbi:flagellar protein FlaG [Thioalkalivibrio sp. ARh3]|uniref:flagellar protein FlaG n=1 Tax=Thioalkalivibrio sp. ARh3 TaxID=1158148 RepID=UPI001E2AB08A|nr:flagellar protein FlaG [Thioalkalivibrio sp. ARh3]